MGYAITKQYRFEAAHHLPNHKGKCRNHHGHSYVVEVRIFGGAGNALERTRPDDSSTGMVLDFDNLDQIVEPMIDQLDHQDLNTLSKVYQPPTAEYIARTIGEHIGRCLPDTRHGTVDPFGPPVSLAYVRVWETAKASAEWWPS